ncbi:Catalase [Solidesulfovibrio carbinoliphilus subsp. oakridgensis]|uniref:Catalase n=1 Tax=Solidesulfovibrio carbinoliphilus subsp. oakridgensis TaxID=694327 RepID=G7Q8N0_9BACT|nr:catalase [Solidesulfovibrio carbinoliphilus]EHJ49117.1 Catalase [Solidesulfovibrio carbinoliphilus subsp. oakridgensis]
MSKHVKKGEIPPDNAKTRAIMGFTADDAGEFLTTNQGVRISHDEDSLKAGKRGPTLLEDFHFREKITHFDHEMIPERVVHARGSGAHGVFECTEAMGEYTSADFLSEAGRQTPVFVRFSQVLGSKGSMDTARDVRGFATKFYTDKGNFDLVGNNIPVFFIQDAIKFPDLIHAGKPEPNTHIPQASTAHDTFWDFISLTPESTHVILWALSDRGITRSYRMMEGFGVNTYRFVNATGQGRFVKFHWKPKLGIHGLVWEEAQMIGGMDSDFLRRDLYDAIGMGFYPEWEFGVQMIEDADEHNFDFDILDPTKIWPEEEVPVKIIGRLTLNRNPDNFFAEVEQVAFHPGHVVPGIDFSNDPLLQGRLFSYLDTQISRLGGPNFHEIPVNRPIAQVHNNQRDAMHRQTINKGRVSYIPNSLGDNEPNVASREQGGFVPYAGRIIEGPATRSRDEKFMDFYSQARMFWLSLTDPERRHLLQAAHFELGKVESKAVRERMVANFNKVDHELAAAIAMGVGVATPPAGEASTYEKSSPAVSMAGTAKGTIESRKVAIIAAPGFDGKQLAAMQEALVAAGAVVEVVSMLLGHIESADGQMVPVKKNYITSASVLYDGVYIPGGQASISMLAFSGKVKNFISEMYRHCKAIAATGEAVGLLESYKLPGLVPGAGKDATAKDLGVIMDTKPKDMKAVAADFITALGQHRAWAREDVKNKVPA